MTTAERPGFTLAPVVETWEATVYQITGSRTAYLVVPRTAATGFTQSLSTGQIDATITDYLNSPDTGRTLDQHALMLTLNLFDRLGDPQNLAAPERDPVTGLSGQARSREDKNTDQQQPQSTSTTTTITARARTLRWPILVGAGIAIIALLGIGIAVANGGDSGADAALGAPAPNVSSGDANPAADGSASVETAGEVRVIGCVKDPATGRGKATVEITNRLDQAATFTLGMSYGSTSGGGADNTNRDPVEVAPGQTVTKVFLSDDNNVSSDVTCFWDQLRWDRGGISGTDGLEFDEAAGRYIG